MISLPQNGYNVYSYAWETADMNSHAVNLLPTSGYMYLSFMWNFRSLKRLQRFHDSIVISKTTRDLWHPNQEGLSPPFHQLVPPETRLVPVSEDLTIGLQLNVALWRLLLGQLKEVKRCGRRWMF